MRFLRFGIAAFLLASTAGAQVVVSQVYGGGQGGAAVYKNDYVELFNPTATPVSLTGWSIQYQASGSTGNWSGKVTLTGSIGANRYFLVQMSDATGSGAAALDLPTPDFTSTAVSMSATAGKIALASNANSLTTAVGPPVACPAGGAVADLVGYGANCGEGASTPALTTTTAAFRANGGCTDTNNNAADFSGAAPLPRNSASPANVCTVGGSTNPSASGSANPSTVIAGSGATLTATVTPGANPASTSLAVTCDLTAIGGSAAFSLTGSGTSFSSVYTVPAGTAPKSYSLACKVTDSQGRSGTFNIGLTVSSLSASPVGAGSANPASVPVGASSLLTVAVTGGSNPASTNLAVTADLSPTGGAAGQQFFDDGTHGDVAAGDNIFSFSATVAAGTAPGSKSLAATITDAQLRTGSALIALTVQFPAAPTSVKISQVYGGGGNSGSTYANDFIELYNPSTAPVDLGAWSIQQTSAAGTTWNVTNLCATNASCILQPGHYYLVQEAQGAGGTTSLPTADVTGLINLGSTSGKVALVGNLVPLSGACPTGSGIADLFGYGGAGTNCSEAAPAAALDNLTAAVRKGNGCIDTGNNANDFVLIGPIPRNSSAPVNLCGGNPAALSGVGTASPSSVDPAGSTLLMVNVAPATSPASSGISVTGDLTSIGGSASQPFYDDATHGDLTAGDRIFSFHATAPLTTGARNIATIISDAQGRTAPGPITITVQSPTCGVERWAVKTGTDADAGLVNLSSAVRTSISALRALPTPGTLPLNNRIAPTETTMYLVNGTMALYKLETDVDYHIVLQDPAGNTMVTEIPSPACDGTTSPFDKLIAAVRAKFDLHLTATPDFQTANLPVQVKGVGFFDFIHGQTGVAPNGIELHPILDVTFTAPSTTAVSSNLNPSVYGQAVTIAAAVGTGSDTPTGNVHFFDGATLIGTGILGSNGRAAFTTNALAAGTHTFTASYEGDSAAAESTSPPFSQTVGKATPAITWPQPASILSGNALSAGQLNASSPVSGTLAYTPPLGTVLPVGNGQILSVTLTPSSGNYAPISKSVVIDVLPASGGGTPPNLILTRTLTHSNGQLVATIGVTNYGGSAAANVVLTVAKIGGVQGSDLPKLLGTIGVGATVQTTISFPDNVTAPGAAGLTVSGTYSGGTFGSTLRIVLP